MSDVQPVYSADDEYKSSGEDNTWPPNFDQVYKSSIKKSTGEANPVVKKSATFLKKYHPSNLTTTPRPVDSPYGRSTTKDRRALTSEELARKIAIGTWQQNAKERMRKKKKRQLQDEIKLKGWGFENDGYYEIYEDGSRKYYDTTGNPVTKGGGRSRRRTRRSLHRNRRQTRRRSKRNRRNTKKSRRHKR